MKKVFTLLTLALLSIGSAWAVETQTLFDAAGTGWKDYANYASASTTINGVSWSYGGSASLAEGSKEFSDGTTWNSRLKLGGGSTFKLNKGSESLSRVFTFTPSEDGVVKVYCIHGSSSGVRTVYISQSITSTDKDVSTALGSFACDAAGTNFGIAEAEVTKSKKVYVWADNNVGIYAITFTPSGAKTTTTVNAAKNNQHAYLENDGSISDDKSTLSFANYPMTIVGENIQAGNVQYQFVVNGNNYTGVKFAASKTYVVTPANGVTITGAKAYGSSNSSTEATLSSGEDNSITLAARGEKNSPVTMTPLDLTTNSDGKYFFTLTGAQSIIVLDVTYDIVENVDVKVSSAGYATLYYGSKLTIPEGVTVYTATKNGDNVKLTEVSDVIPANTGVILEAAEGKYNFSVTTDEAPVIGSNILTGTTTGTTVDANSVYTLGQNSEGVVGLRLYTGTSIRAYSAYATSLSGARFFNFSFGDSETTGLNDVSSKMEDVRGDFYNLNGQRISQPTKGLYIVNGRKVIVK